MASVNEKNIFFPNAELMNVGCKNCIWKLHNQCPYGLKNDEIYPDDVLIEQFEEIPSHSGIVQIPKPPIPKEDEIKGICPDMINFLVSLADKNDSLTSIWEKFYIYKARLQESHDYKDFINLDKKIKLLEKELESEKNTYSDEELKENIDRLKSDRMAAKIWWAKLNQYVVFSMQKIVDRETKQNEMPRLAGIHSSGTINFNIEKKEIKQIEEK